MSKTARRRGRPTIYDPELIAKLLAERADSGEPVSSLSARSGIPESTLYRYAARRRRSDRVSRTNSTDFMEIVVPRRGGGAMESAAAASAGDLRILVRERGDAREVIVPPTFDPLVLQRVITALESGC